MNALPQHILDHISGFNAEHREQMAPVLQDIVNPRCDNCYNCSTGENENVNENQRNEQIVRYIMWKKYVFCCMWCVVDGEENLRS